MQKPYQWKLKQREIVLGDRTLLMGVLNVTPDSFSDGGLYARPRPRFRPCLGTGRTGRRYHRHRRGVNQAGFSADTEAEELRRLIPVLKRLSGKIGIPISVDTYKSNVAEKAIEHGAEIINDPTGILLDLQLPKVVVKHDAGLIINHMRGNPETWAKLPPVKDLMRTIAIDMEAAIHRVRHAGVQKNQIVIDPGLGFGKRREQNSEIIAKLGMLRASTCPSQWAFAQVIPQERN